MDRRELFTSFLNPIKKEKKNKEVIVRPPYFKDIDSFYKECITCDGICSTLCEENIIIIGKDKTPHIDFTFGGCTYCDACAKGCPHDVLMIENKQNIDVCVEINMLECLSWNNTMCFSCKDPCLEDAIIFASMFKPFIEENQCTSCGFCINRCPTNAIKIGVKNVS